MLRYKHSANSCTGKHAAWWEKRWKLKFSQNFVRSSAQCWLPFLNCQMCWKSLIDGRMRVQSRLWKVQELWFHRFSLLRLRKSCSLEGRSPSNCSPQMCRSTACSVSRNSCTALCSSLCRTPSPQQAFLVHLSIRSMSSRSHFAILSHTGFPVRCRSCFPNDLWSILYPSRSYYSSCMSK